MSGYSLEDRQNENPNYKPFSGKTEFSIDEHIFIRIFGFKITIFYILMGLLCLFLSEIFTKPLESCCPSKNPNSET